MAITILVTGATGKTGRRLIPRLRARGAEVRAASRRADAGYIRFDWARPETYDAALRGADAIYLVPPDLVEDPTPLVGPFLSRAAELGVGRVVALSSLGVTFPREEPDSGRLRLERQIVASGLAWTLLRPSGFAQNFSEGFMLPGILQAGMIATATGDGAAAFIDADDIAAVAAAALTEPGHDGAAYALTGPAALTFAEAAKTIGEVVGRTIAHRPIPSTELLTILQSAGLPVDYAAMVVRDQEAIRDGSGAVVTDDVARVTGRPATTFADYAARAASAWGQQ